MLSITAWDSLSLFQRDTGTFAWLSRYHAFNFAASLCSPNFHFLWPKWKLCTVPANCEGLDIFALICFIKRDKYYNNLATISYHQWYIFLTSQLCTDIDLPMLHSHKLYQQSTYKVLTFYAWKLSFLHLIFAHSHKDQFCSKSNTPLISKIERTNEYKCHSMSLRVSQYFLYLL